ncbi:helix-turn-helix transcriptional regulator [Aestuariispira insulae]|uniref:Putative transcriptional regulator YheO n=1 Tax=Aestuariispira insulae TaxID=1461337 RepID=A0A3D9HRV6_9PROT|nr:PAS domain-containing protein [Aestuariispira insulae]RED52200.1 putative transcriptional regulator YheO [Aestuariispira insulae]
MDYLDTYKRTADGIAALMHPHAEVVVHDLSSQQIAYLANNYSNREVGSPSLLEEIDFAEGETVIGPYRKINWDGRVLKSISIVMNGADGRPEALLCINMDMSDMDRMHKVLGLMLDAPQENQAVDALFKDDWHERINLSMQEWLHDRGLSLQALSREDKRNLVSALEEKGAFAGQGSANYVARCLGLGRATIYKYLKELRA